MIDRMRDRLARRDERGSTTLFFVVIAMALFLMVGLVVDGGGKIRALQQANDVAQEAARAAGQGVNGPGAVYGRTITADPGKAQAAAQSVIANSHLHGGAHVIDGTHVAVDVDNSYKPVFLSMFGVGTMHVHAKQTAVLVVTGNGVDNGQVGGTP